MSTTNYDPLIMQHRRVDTEAPIGPEHIECVLLHAIRSPVYFVEARRELLVELFDPISERVYCVLWAAMLDASTQSSRLTFEVLATELRARLRNDPDCLFDKEEDLLLRQDTDGLLWSSFFAVPEDQLDYTYARNCLQQLLHERTVIEPLRRLLLQGHDRAYVAGFGNYLRAAMFREQRISAMAGQPTRCAMPDLRTYRRVPDVVVPTTLTFIDNFMVGARPCDANGILGPYGSGKSTLAAQLSVACARAEGQTATSEGRRRKVGFLLCYEEPMRKFETRVWSVAANIRRERLAGVAWEQFSTATALLEYERQLDRNLTATRALAGEQERWIETMEWLNDTLVLVDMSGSGEFPNAGAGYVDEMVGVIERELTERNAEAGTVVIDYAGICCRRHMRVNNISEDRLRHYVGGFGDDVRRMISERFRCTSWIFHQLSGEANSRASTAAQKYTDSAEAKNFAENMAVCGVLGTKDRDTGCISLDWGKIRYADNTNARAVLQIDPGFSRMNDVTGAYVVPQGQRRYMPAQAAAEVYGAAATAEAIQQRNYPARVMSAAGANVPR